VLIKTQQQTMIIIGLRCM